MTEAEALAADTVRYWLTIVGPVRARRGERPFLAADAWVALGNDRRDDITWEEIRGFLTGWHHRHAALAERLAVNNGRGENARGRLYSNGRTRSY